MRSRVNAFRTVLTLALGAALGSCADGRLAGTDAPLPAARVIPNGPAADYPVIIGEPFTIEGVTHTPADTMNYDEVGYAAADQADAMGVTAAHRTLPLPSYIEVTALDSGRTALVRVERRGPMTNARLIALSGAASAQLGIGEGSPVRVRRVNPPEEHRAELRAGQQAPLRMETPAGLLEVLRRKLPAPGAATFGDARQADVSGQAPTPPAVAQTDPVRRTADETSRTEPVVAAEPVAGAEGGDFVVQLGAFAVRVNADRLAVRTGGFVDTGGRFALVRTGPYATRGQAEQALAKLRAQGYSDARIETIR